MKKLTVWMITATALMLAGVLIFGGAMTMFNWDFSKFSTTKLVTNEHDVNDSFKNISVISNTANVILVPSSDEKCTVTCFEEQKQRHAVSVKEDTLTIEIVDERKWYDHIGVTIGSPKITVTIPEGEYERLTVNTTTGNVETSKAFSFESIGISATTGNITNLSSSAGEISLTATTGAVTVREVTAGSLALNATTGKLTVSKVNCEGDVETGITTGRTDITDLKCKNLTSKGETGGITLKNTISEAAFYIERTTGGIRFEKSDAAEITARTSTGSIKGSLLSEKIFFASSSTGRVNVPKTLTGGKCELTTSTGSIEITVEQRGE